MVIEPNILAFQNADLLDLIDQAAEQQIATTDGLAAAAKRDPSNLRKTLKRLIDDGLINEDPLSNGLTDDGRAQLAAFKRAQHGGERKRPRGQWPLDKFRPNPLNRPVRREVLPDMAASMRGPAGLVQRIRATEPDANGVRMIVDGEHRWEAAKLLVEQAQADPASDIPAWLADGMPFEEADADPATALVITLVANARRADMSPWDDARQLLKLQQATDWTASELARRIGRVSEGERSGLRDVQQKLKIAREATPEAVADYERTGSWDTLRASVTTPKAPALGEQVAQAGAAVLAPQSVEAPSDGPEDEPLTPAAELALVEIVWAMRWTPFSPPGHDTAVLTDGYHYMSEGMGLLVRNGLIDYLGWNLDTGRACVVRPTDKAMAWAAERFDQGSPNLSQLIAWRDRIGLPSGRRPPSHGDDEGFYTSTLNTAAKRKQLLTSTPAPTSPHVVNGVDYGNATRANEARRAIGLLPPIPPANYGGARATDDQAEVSPSTPAAPATTPAPPPTPSLGQHLQTLADEDKERKRQGLRATLEVLLERLEPVLTILNGDRTDGVLPIDSDEADYFQEQLAEASRWAEDALAAVGVFDPLPGEEIARKDIGSPAVPIRQSITSDHIVCLFDGRKFKSLKRHLRTRYDMSPDEYRAKWRLPADYPMVAPNYAKAREDLARQMGVRLASKGAAR